MLRRISNTIETVEHKILVDKLFNSRLHIAGSISDIAFEFKLRQRKWQAKQAPRRKQSSSNTILNKMRGININTSYIIILLAKISVLSFMTPVAAAFAPSKAFQTRTKLVQMQMHPLDLNSLPSFLLSDETITEFAVAKNEQNYPASTATPTSIGVENAFTDDVVLFDSTVQLLLGGFVVFVVLATAAKFFLNQMDSAIEKVLVDFESTMKRKYASRWVSIEAQLDGLEEPKRSQKLFAIMENLQASEPEFMAKVNKDMEKIY